MSPVFLPPSLYATAKSAGYDMSGFAIQQPIPIRDEEKV